MTNEAEEPQESEDSAENEETEESQETTEAQKPKKYKRPWHEHPLLTVLLFGVIVSAAGTWLQHRYMLKLEEVSREKTKQEKIFDKRSEIAIRLMHLIKRREINSWNLLGSCRNDDRALHVKYWETSRELINEFFSIKQEIMIFFGEELGNELCTQIYSCEELWHDDVEDRLKAYPSCKEVTDEYMMKKIAEAKKYEDKIMNIFKRLLWGT